METATSVRKNLADKDEQPIERMAELLACAHCGSKADYNEDSSSYHFPRYIHCTNEDCGAMIPCNNFEEGKAAWNRRANH